ncbi:MAG: hypothetical protein LBP54_03615 [Campylobacteraceae bacterium]|nr:hypothetical protein [Campylobacteraceae bacterium]
MYQARHTFAIKALDSKKFKASQIAYMLGHTSLKMLFEKYAKFIEGEVDKVDATFSILDTKSDTQCA